MELQLRNDGIAMSDLGGEIVILDLRTSVYFSMRGTAAFLVAELAKGASAETLVQRLLDVYDTTEQTATTDVESFIAELRGHELLEPAHA